MHWACMLLSSVMLWVVNFFSQLYRELKFWRLSGKESTKWLGWWAVERSSPGLKFSTASEKVCNCGQDTLSLSSKPWLVSFKHKPSEGNGTPLQCSCLENPRRSLVGCSPWGREESDKTQRLHFHFSFSCIGEGNGNPLQCSCLENPRDGGAWWAAVYGVAQSWTRLKWRSSSSSSVGFIGFSGFH